MEKGQSKMFCSDKMIVKANIFSLALSIHLAIDSHGELVAGDIIKSPYIFAYFLSKYIDVKFLKIIHLE